MAQYVIQIQTSDGRLVKNFEVTEESPIPGSVSAGREQIIMTNTDSFDEISAKYDQYTTGLAFTYNEGAGTISCTGAYSHTWDKD